MLACAIEAEAADWIDARAGLRDEAQHRLVVREGHQPERTVQTGRDPMPIRKPLVHDRHPEGERESFGSVRLPRYIRRSKSLDVLIPNLYLRGVSTGDFNEALAVILGESPGISASTITRIVAGRQDEQREWPSSSARRRNARDGN